MAAEEKRVGEIPAPAEALELSSDELLALARLSPRARLLGLAIEVPDRSAAARAERGRRALFDRGILVEADDSEARLAPKHTDRLGPLTNPEVALRATHRSGERAETRTYVVADDHWAAIHDAGDGYGVTRGCRGFVEDVLGFVALTPALNVTGDAFTTTLESINRAVGGDEAHPAAAASLVAALRTRATASSVATLHWEGKRLVGGELTWIDGVGAGVWVLEPLGGPGQTHETGLHVEPVGGLELLRRLFEYLPGAPIGPVAG